MPYREPNSSFATKKINRSVC